MTASVFAQGKASVYAANSDISDNLDLRAVASIFGESKDLSDFEYRLNDPNLQISNLDLNNDNEVDYLRVVEMVENGAHLVVLQAVLQQDVYQDVATIAVSRNKSTKVQIQIIGDPYMYGANYIYNPVYVVQPPLYSVFWGINYRPYRSYYGWNHYPTFYRPWSPYSYNIYRKNVYAHINHNNYYNYGTTIYNSRANDYYRKNRSNGYEQKYPNRDFKHRTSQVNKYEYDRAQKTRTPQVATGARPSSNYNKTTATARPANTVGTRAESSKAASSRPTTTSSSRPVTNATSRPATTVTSRSDINSTNTSRPAATINNRPSTTSSRPASNMQSSAQKSANNSQRASAPSNNAQQRSSNSSARSPQPSSGSNNTRSHNGTR